MSDDPVKPTRYQVRATGEVGPGGLFGLPQQPKCPICQSTAWERRIPTPSPKLVEQLPPGQTVGTFFDMVGATDGNRNLFTPVARFVCAQCGFIRDHAADFVR